MTTYQPVPDPVAFHLPTVAEVSLAVGADVAVLVEPGGALQPGGALHPGVAGAALLDPAAPPPAFPGAIALAIGLVPADPGVASRIQDIADAGYLALVYKAHGASDDGLRAAARAAGIGLFRASDTVPWNQLSEFIDAAVVPYGASRGTLVDIRPGDLFELANTVASLAGGAVAIADVDQTLLAYSTLPGQPIDDTRRSSILQLHVPHTEQNDIDYRRVHSAAGVVSVAPAAHSFTRRAVAIRAGSVVLGSLWLIDTDHDTGTDAERVLAEAANVAALHLLHRRTHHDADRARQLALVRPLLFEPDRAELAAVQLGIAADTVRVVAVTAHGPADNAPDALQAGLRLFDTVRSASALWLPAAVCGIADNIVYVVLPQGAASSPAFQREAVLRIAHHTRRVLARPIFAGFGTETAIHTTATSRAEAEAVLSAVLRDAEDGRVQSDSDDIVADQQSLGPRLKLRQIADALRATGLLPGDAATLISDHDERRNTAFAQTLLAWLDCGMNAIETASRLGLHANTVRYRLSRIEPLFGLRLDDPETKLLLWLQLWAREN
ncbi:PucR family transcriptional regulator [Glaciibacter sp. 2TAF33]|uniref:PucR family transcriptional regulator n=1 Tax=Glaciibacter sp. 2TAF33 TaxID=3233015 RepID=UPI003F9368EF